MNLFHLGRTDALDLAILDNPQQLGLHGQRGFADLLEKNGAAIGVFEQSGLRVRCSDKRAAHVPEQLAFEQGVHQRRAIASVRIHAAGRPMDWE